MIGSQGINDLSRAAGDESLKRPQRVNEDGHDEKDKGGRDQGRNKPDSDEGQVSDSYEHTAEGISAKSVAPSVAPSAMQSPLDAPGGSSPETGAPKQVNTVEGADKGTSEAVGHSESTIKGQKRHGTTEERTPEDTDHIDLVG